MFDVQLENKSGHTILNIIGNIDSASAPIIQQKIESNTQPNNSDSSLILNFSNVEYISSAGIRVLLQYYKACHKNNKKVIITNISSAVENTLYITGFLNYFLVYDNIEEALNSLKNE